MPTDWSPGVPTARDQQILQVLRARDGHLTLVRLLSGDLLDVWDIAWGYDAGDRWAHVTTNISPGVEGRSSDFFFTYEVAELVDPDVTAPLLSPSEEPPPDHPSG